MSRSYNLAEWPLLEYILALRDNNSKAIHYKKAIN